MIDKAYQRKAIGAPTIGLVMQLLQASIVAMLYDGATRNPTPGDREDPASVVDHKRRPIIDAFALSHFYFLPWRIRP